MQEEMMSHIAKAFAEETKAASRNAAFVLKAEKEGYKELARLFKAVAAAKSVHARRFHFLMRGKIGISAENLMKALEDELKFLRESLPGMVKEAKKGSTAVRKAFVQSMKTNQEVVQLYREAECLEKGTVYYVCQICGHIHRKAAPKKCPICRAVPSRFRRME